MLFYKNYIVYYNVYCYYCGVFIEKYVCTKFHLNWLLCQWVTWPLFNKNYIVYYNVYCFYCGVFIEKYVYTKFRLDWLLCEWFTWPYMSLL